METTEFSLDGFTDYCKLKWSKPRLAKNLNWYRKAEPTEEFWDWYNGSDKNDKEYKKSQKEFLKKHGLSIYKEYDNWGLFDWNFPNKGTKDEYEEQQENMQKELFNLLMPELIKACSKESPGDYKIAKRELERCLTLEDLEEYAKYEILYGEKICNRIRAEYSLT